MIRVAKSMGWIFCLFCPLKDNILFVFDCQQFWAKLSGFTFSFYVYDTTVRNLLKTAIVVKTFYPNFL